MGRVDHHPPKQTLVSPPEQVVKHQANGDVKSKPRSQRSSLAAGVNIKPPPLGATKQESANNSSSSQVDSIEMSRLENHPPKQTSVSPPDQPVKHQANGDIKSKPRSQRSSVSAGINLKPPPLGATKGGGGSIREGGVINRGATVSANSRSDSLIKTACSGTVHNPGSIVNGQLNNKPYLIETDRVGGAQRDSIANQSSSSTKKPSNNKGQHSATLKSNFDKILVDIFVSLKHSSMKNQI